MEQIGTLYVDAGIIMLGDPCYSLPDDATNRDDTAKTWSKFCDKLDGDVSSPLGKGISIVVSSGYGDGEYPVFVKRKDGRIQSVTVKFF